MATSGVYTFQNIRVQELLTEAFQRCGVPEEKLTAVHMASGRRSMNLLQSHWANKQLNLWCVEMRGLTLVQGQNTYDLPAGTVDVIEVFTRTYDRPGGDYTSSAGGTAANAFDNDLSTACTQTSSNGRIYVDFGAEEAIEMVGYAASADTSVNLVFEYSDDAVTWTTAYETGTTTFEARVGQWWNVPAPVSAQYFGVRATGGATLSCAEAYFINDILDQLIGRVPRSTYAAISNKDVQSSNVSSWMVNRTDSPTLSVYPTPNGDEGYNLLVYNRLRYMETVTAATETLDVPQRFLEAMAADLAFHLSRKFAPEMTPRLKADADEAWRLAAWEDRDRAPFTFAFDMTSYGRF